MAVERLAVFLPGLYGGGAERTMLSLAGGFAERGHDVDLILAKTEGPYVDQIPDNVRLVELHAARTLTSLPGLVRYLRRERPVAMVSALSRASLIAARARKWTGLPSFLAVCEQNTVSVSAREATAWRKRFVPQLARAFYPWASAVVGVSQGVVDDLVENVRLPRELVKVVYNPGVTDDLQRRSQEAPDHPWFQGDRPPVLLAVGALIPQKDYPNLLHAMVRVRASTPARLVILGEGRDRPMLEALISELGLGDAVALPGFVKNPYAYMSAADVFVMSSGWEGLPTVLVEALCCGARIVSTDCPSGPREILRAGEYGRLVAVGQPDQLAEAILETLGSEVRRPPPESWQPYTLDAVVDDYLALLLPGERPESPPSHAVVKD
jgi:glycosyltransferase involved in cell wall biosynthesis